MRVRSLTTARPFKWSRSEDRPLSCIISRNEINARVSDVSMVLMGSATFMPKSSPEESDECVPYKVSMSAGQL